MLLLLSQEIQVQIQFFQQLLLQVVAVVEDLNLLIVIQSEQVYLVDLVVEVVLVVVHNILEVQAISHLLVLHKVLMVV